MQLSKISEELLNDRDIQKIVYNDIVDNGENCKYGLVFGNSMLIKERVHTALEAYKNGRIKKIIFSGGVNGVSNQTNDDVSEARKMSDLAISLGVKKVDV